MLKWLDTLSKQFEMYSSIAEFIILFIALWVILHYINKLVKLPHLTIFFITLNLFLLLPKFTIKFLRVLIKAVFVLLMGIIVQLTSLFHSSRLQLIIIFNIVFIGIFALKYYLKKKKKGKESRPVQEQINTPIEKPGSFTEPPDTIT